MDLSVLEKRIGFVFRNKGLLKQAVTHKSYINEHRDEDLQHNERLEFLGDSVVELVVTTFLYSQYPQKAEGELTTMRCNIVCNKTATAVASKLGLNGFLLLSKSQANEPLTSRAMTNILSDTFEALVGALYIDQGYSVAEQFIHSHLLDKLPDSLIQALESKALLQEKVQAKFKHTPTYKTLREEGPDDKKIFTIGLYFDGKLMACGMGLSKREAETNAAKSALETHFK